MSFRQRGFDGGALLCETQGAMNGGPLSGVQEALRILRERKHLSQREAASRAGMDSGGLSKIESGKQSLRVATLDKLLAVYDADLLDLQHALTGEPRPPAPPDPSPVPALQQGSIVERPGGFDRAPWAEALSRLSASDIRELMRSSSRLAIDALKYVAASGTIPDSDAGRTEGRGNGGTVPARGSAGHDRPREQSPGRPPAKAR
jgi:transcriptional regulator with XRE-family HTH domain